MSYERFDSERTLLEGLIHYLSILLKYRWLIIGTTAVASLGIVAFCVASLRLSPEKSPLPNEYTATSTILVHKGTENDLSSTIRSALGITTGPSDTETGFDNGAFLLMILQSRTFLDKIVEEFGIVGKYRLSSHTKSQSRKMLLAKFRFENNRATGTITISCKDIDPVFARDLTNRMVALLLEWYSQNVGNTNQRQKQLLEEKISEVKADIDRLEGQLNELQRRYGVQTAQDLGSSQASTLAALRSQLILKDIDIRNYSSISSAENPKLIQLQEERQNILDLITRMQQGMTETIDSSASRKSLPDVQMEFNNLTVELEIQRKIHSTLSHQFEVAKLTSDSEPPFQIMELAEIPDEKSGPQRMRIVEEVILIAFIGSVVFAFLLNSISQFRSTQNKKAIPRKGG